MAVPSIRIEHADCLEAIPRLLAEGVEVDSVVTDPPYHLVAIGDRSKYKIKHGRDGAMKRLLSGFMGTTWDGGDVAFRPETWATVGMILRPGGFLLAFGGTRTYHRVTSAIEDAGFVVQDSILDLVSTDSRADAFLASLSADQLGALEECQSGPLLAWVYGSGFPKRRDMLKPAWEPIIVAYKPGGKRTLQVEECRIGTDGGAGNVIKRYEHLSKRSFGNWGYHKVEVDDTVRGRWPANVCHDGSGEVEEVFGAFGDSKSTRAVITSKPGKIYGGGKGLPSHTGEYGFDDEGSVARFFYTAKADAVDRLGSGHPTVKPLELLRWLVPLVTPPGGLVLDPFAGTGTTGIAARGTGRDSILIEREEQYVADIRQRVDFFGISGSRRRPSASASAQRNKVDKPTGSLF